MPSNIYINSQSFDFVLKDLNFEAPSLKQQELLDRATADFEADMAEKYYVPLVNKNDGAFSTCPQFAVNKVLNAMKAKIRAIIGIDQNRNLVIESTERYIDTHGKEYRDQIKSLLENKINYGFKLLEQAEDAREAVQSLGLARSNNNVNPDGVY